MENRWIVATLVPFSPHRDDASRSSSARVLDRTVEWMMVAKPTMQCRLVENVLLAVHTGDTPSEEEWSNYLEVMRPLVPHLETIVGMAVTEGGGPNAKQRMQMNEVLAGKSARGVALSSSMMVRGIVTALRWFNPLMRAYAPDRFADACDYLNLAPDTRQRIKPAIDAMRTDLGLAPLFANSDGASQRT